MPKLMKPSFSVVCCTPDMLGVIEDAARKCYLSEPKVAAYDHNIGALMMGEARLAEQDKFLRDKIKLGHLSVLEHGNITVDFVFDRGVSHEEVRHRIQAISQESTRYCNYSKDKYDNEIAVIQPFFYRPDEPKAQVLCPIDGVREMNKFDIWLEAIRFAEWSYLTLLEMGSTPQEARSILPNSLKTEMRVTTNVREWRHILKIRTEAGVHPQMAEIMVPTLAHFKEAWPVLFEDIEHSPKWNLFLDLPMSE